MPPLENRWTKKRKAEEEAAIVPAANVVVQFQSDAGEKAGECCYKGVVRSLFSGICISGLQQSPVWSCRTSAERSSGCNSQAVEPAAESAVGQ